jgi:hypothetical protein
MPARIAAIVPGCGEAVSSTAFRTADSVSEAIVLVTAAAVLPVLR